MINWKRISSLLQHFPILSYIQGELTRKDMHCTRSGAWHLGATIAQFLQTHARTHAHSHTHTHLKLSVFNQRVSYTYSLSDSSINENEQVPFFFSVVEGVVCVLCVLYLYQSRCGDSFTSSSSLILPLDIVTTSFFFFFLVSLRIKKKSSVNDRSFEIT